MKLPEITTIDTASREKRGYPFDKLECGQQFVIEEPHLNNSIKACVAEFNKQHPGVNIKTNKQADGSTRVYRELIDDPSLPTTNPTEPELAMYLASWTIGNVGQFQSMYKARFDQFRQWIARMESLTPMRFACVVNDDVLTITRKPDYLAPEITPLSYSE